jgi:hypothetical protein
MDPNKTVYGGRTLAKGTFLARVLAAAALA